MKSKVAGTKGSHPERSSKRRRVATDHFQVDATKKSTTKRKTKRQQTDTRKARASAILQHRKKRKKEAKQEALKNPKKKNEGNIVAEDFWQVEKVVGRRVRKKKVEYLIRWVGLPESQNTWEPGDNLCDTAMVEARRFTKEQKELEKKREFDERRLGLGLPPAAAKETAAAKEEVAVEKESQNTNDESSNTAVGDKEVSPAWNDLGHVKFRDVERINVNDKDAGERVTVARESGIPVVLVGHVGWANFAKRWLVRDAACPNGATKVEEQEGEGKKRVLRSRKPASGDESKGEGALAASSTCMKDAPLASCASAGEEQNDDSLSLDLSLAHSLDVSRMIEDIGHEVVPIVRRNYNEENPIEGNIEAKKFLTKCWPDSTRSTSHSSAPELYLHQWQFPLSDTAGRKMCHQNKPLPNGILGQDLLKFWLDLPQCKADNPLQYLFMGNEGTMSKLHRDNGGLAISIAPIIGEKECVLVHRSDGPVCMYHLNADLCNIDLQSYPLMAHARIWKTTVRPGEILLMPHGTYHQCRNLTPCLSYSRFHLDTVNLLPFLQSMIDGDAPEIDHDEIIWNCTTELIKAVDSYIDEVRDHAKSPSTNAPVPLSDSMVDMVETLQSLRHICREISRRDVLKKALRTKTKVPPVETDCASDKANGGPSRKGLCQYSGVSGRVAANADGVVGLVNQHKDRPWDLIVDDVDVCLHEFEHRHMTKVPKFRPRRVEELEMSINSQDGGSHEPSNNRRVKTSSLVLSDSDSSTDETSRHVAYGTQFEKQFLGLPNARADLSGSLDEEPAVNDFVVVNVLGKRVKGTILQIESEMNAALLSYEEYPSLYDEYQPYERLRLPISGEGGVEIDPKDVTPGLVVLNRWGDLGEEYRAVVQSTASGTFYFIQLEFGSCRTERWVTLESILERSSDGSLCDSDCSQSAVNENSDSSLVAAKGQ